jgi:hypothetical protein
MFNTLFLPPSGQERPEVLFFAKIGTFISQPVLFAAWASLGPPPAVMRVPLSMAAFATVLLAIQFGYTRGAGGPDRLESLVIQSALLLAGVAIGLVVRRFTHWRIERSTVDLSPSAANQFSLRFLLILTTICAALLGLGRTLFATETAANSPAIDFLWRILWMLPTFLCITIPPVLVPIMILAPRVSGRKLVAIPVFWAVLTYLAVELIYIGDRPQADTRWTLAWQILRVQLGAAITAVISALVVRFAGYRLVNNR